MKKLLIPVAAILFTGVVNAASDEEIYHGFAKGNPDLESSSVYSASRIAVQPGVGSGFGVSRSSKATGNDIYHGFERNNPDLWSDSSSSRVEHGTTSANDIYHGFEEGNPDL